MCTSAFVCLVVRQLRKEIEERAASQTPSALLHLLVSPTETATLEEIELPKDRPGKQRAFSTMHLGASGRISTALASWGCILRISMPLPCAGKHPESFLLYNFKHALFWCSDLVERVER